MSSCISQNSCLRQIQLFPRTQICMNWFCLGQKLAIQAQPAKTGPENSIILRKYMTKQLFMCWCNAHSTGNFLKTAGGPVGRLEKKRLLDPSKGVGGEGQASFFYQPWGVPALSRHGLCPGAFRPSQFCSISGPPATRDVEWK